MRLVSGDEYVVRIRLPKADEIYEQVVLVRHAQEDASYVFGYVLRNQNT